MSYVRLFQLEHLFLEMSLSEPLGNLLSQYTAALFHPVISVFGTLSRHDQYQTQPCAKTTVDKIMCRAVGLCNREAV